MKNITNGQSRFTTILEGFTLNWEIVTNSRGDVIAEHDPADPGGVTKFGIDQRSHPGIDVENLTRDQAVRIYRDNDWAGPRCADFPLPLGEALFDTVVLNGRPTAIRLLQGAVRTKADGIIGPATLRAAAICDPPLAASGMLAARDAHFRAIAAANPRLARYLKGWLNRNRALRTFLRLPAI